MSLESAFSTGGIVGHIAYVLLVVSMLMRSITYLRIFVIFSAIVAITYAVIWLKDPVSAFWETLLVIVNVVQIALIWYGNHRARFTEEEQAMIGARLSGLARREARRLLSMGTWMDGEPGTVLTQEGEPVKYLVFLLRGLVRIEVKDQKVGICGPGNFVGEMSLVGDTPASATAVVDEPSRYWMIDTDRVRSLRVIEPSMAAALEMGIAHDMKTKLMAANAEPRSAATSA